MKQKNTFWKRVSAKIPKGRWNTRMVLLFIAAILISFQMGKCMQDSSEGMGAAHEHGAGTVWTCSMHPQIRMEEFGQCPICFMDLIPVASDQAGSEHGEHSLVLSESARRLSRITSAPVERRSGHTSVKLTGKILADEGRIAVISSRIAGRVDRLIVNETGTQVRRGAPLAVLYSPELMAVQQELISAAAALDSLGEGASAMVLESAGGNVKAAREKMILLGFSDADISEILRRKTPSEQMTIRSAQAGVVLERKVSQGDYVREGMPLFHIADLSRVWALLDAYESDLVHIRTGYQVELSIGAFPGERFMGTVSFIDPVIDARSRTARVRVVVDNAQGRLKPGMFLRGDIVPRAGAQRVGAELSIPSTAPLFTGERSIVYVEIDGGEHGFVYEGREVMLGSRAGNTYTVVSGLEEGERVVVYGAFRIDSELQIRGKPSMMSPEGGRAESGHAHHGAADKREVQPLREKSVDLQAAPELRGFTEGAEPGKAFRADLEKVYDAYFSFVEVLAADDRAGAVRTLGLVYASLRTVRDGAGEAYGPWDEVSTAVFTGFDTAFFLRPLEELRHILEPLSGHIISLQAAYGHNADIHYAAYCPMAFNNKGAYWLQRQEQIANPYFGSAMLRCGEIREEFAPR